MNKDLIINKDGLTEKEFLAQYDDSKYKKPSSTVDMIIFTVMSEEEQNIRKLDQKELQVLMIRRGDHPYIGQWALPGGFVNYNESLDDAARRELKEETNIDRIYMEQLYAYGSADIDETTGRFKRDPRTRVISHAYMSLVDSTILNVMAGDDAADAKWFSVDDKVIKEEKTIKEDGYILKKWVKLELKNEEDEISAVILITKTVEDRVSEIRREVVESTGTAFDHGGIIQYGLERLRNKIEYTDIVFNLMPQLFTLTDLQQVYEIILKRELHKSNFRREMEDTKKIVIKTNKTTKSLKDDKSKKAVRPSALYKFNPHWNE